MTKGQTSKLEAKKKKGAASTQRWQRALPAGWIQGDFLPSTVRENDVLELVEHGMVVNKSWRLPEGEMEPTPKEGERVLLLSHMARGFSLPPHPFFRVSNGNPIEEEEGIMEGSAGSAEYVSDSRETEEETEEEEEESEEQISSPSPPEHRTKHRHDPAVPPAPPVAPSARSVKRTRGSSAEPVDQPSKVAKPGGSKPRKALPRMRIAVPVASAAATSATSLPHQGDDPMDTDNAATSQQVGLPSEVIHLDDDDQRMSKPALAPVVGVIQPTENPAMSVPPTETVVFTAEPIGAQLGMPRELGISRAPSTTPGPSTVQYDARRLPEDQVGAAKDAMVQVELMVGEAKGAYDSVASLYKKSLELRDDIRKTCEMGSDYNSLKAEKTQLAADLEVAANDLAGMKKALAEREVSLEESRGTNKALLAEVEKMKKERYEWMGQLNLMNAWCKAQENYVGDWAKKVVALLGDFCRDVEAKIAEIERSLGQPNVPLGDEANRDMFRLNSRLNKVGPFIGRLREVVGRIDNELWPEDDSRNEIEGLMTRLEDVPSRVHTWKKSAARCGTDVALSLVRVHCKEAREDKLKTLQVANTKILRFEDFMETFLDTATRIADGIDLDTFVEPASPGDA
ncbi:hypothetical protein ZWY2020_050298 [Hordeum vulgare]|nr:hypothetical protein ZWY2020_050298 [Hordeum vulgare]